MSDATTTDAAFTAAWWQVSAATMWVLTRDRQLTNKMQERNSDSTLSIILSLAISKHVEGREIETKFGSANQAQHELLAAMKAGSIRTVGNAFEYYGGSSGAARHFHPVTRDIPDIELGSLVFEEHDGEDVLVHHDWRVSRGSIAANLRGLKDIQVRREDVMLAFPADDALPAPVIVPMPVERLSVGQVRDMKMPDYETAYQDFVAQSSERPRIGGDDIPYMQQRFPEISIRTVQDLRRKLGLPQWKKQGRDPRK